VPTNEAKSTFKKSFIFETFDLILKIYFAKIHIFFTFVAVKKLAKYLFSSLLTILYITGFVGFGVHKCHTEGTADLFLMMGDISCESIHHHIHDHNDCCDAQCDSHPFHYTDCSSECCSTDVFAVTSEQDRLQDEDMGLSAQTIAVSLLCDDLTALSYSTIVSPSGDLNPLKVGLPLSALSIWRL